MTTASSTTGLDPTAIQGMIGKHRDLKHTIDNFINQAATTVGDIESQNSGAMVQAIQNVFETWKGGIDRVQGDLDNMIGQLQQTLDSLVSFDQSNAQSVTRAAGR